MAQEIKEFETLTELLSDLDHNNIYGYERKRLVDQFMMMRARIVHKPYSASFEITPLCNLDCKMCYVHLDNEQLIEKGILSTDEWIDILQQAIDAGIMHADLTGGECLTHPGFKQIYLYLISHGIKVAVLTNGLLLSQEMINFFSKYPPSIIQITLYGSNDEIYEKVTGKAVFDKVFNAINLAKNAGLNLRIVMTPNRYMQGDEKHILDMLHNIGIKYEIGSATLPPRTETGRLYDDFTMDVELYAHMMKLENQYRSKNHSYSNVPKVEYKFRVRGMENVKGLPCAAGTAAFHINWKGEMTPCIPYYTLKHSVRKKQLLQAWEYINNRVRTFSEPVQCVTCSYRDICNTCSAEKTSCVLNGPINIYVCKRLEQMIKHGLINHPTTICT